MTNLSPILKLQPKVKIHQQQFYRLENEKREKFYRRVLHEIAQQVHEQVFRERM